MQQLGEAPLGLGAEHKVDVVVRIFYLVGHDLLLRHAAAEADDLVGLGGLRVAEAAQVAVNALFRVLADGAATFCWQPNVSTSASGVRVRRSFISRILRVNSF